MPEKKTITSNHYNVAQLRVETWNNLKNRSTKLQTSTRGSTEEKEVKKEVREILKELESIECYFAVPGVPRLRALNEVLDRKEHAAISHRIADIIKHLVSGK